MALGDELVIRVKLGFLITIFAGVAGVSWFTATVKNDIKSLATATDTLQHSVDAQKNDFIILQSNYLELKWNLNEIKRNTKN